MLHEGCAKRGGVCDCAERPCALEPTYSVYDEENELVRKASLEDAITTIREHLLEQIKHGERTVTMALCFDVHHPIVGSVDDFFETLGGVPNADDT